MSFYQPDFILKLKYDSFRPVLTYNLLTRHVIYYKKMFRFFFTKYKNEWKEHNFQ